MLTSPAIDSLATIELFCGRLCMPRAAPMRPRAAPMRISRLENAVHIRQRRFRGRGRRSNWMRVLVCCSSPLVTCILILTPRSGVSYVVVVVVANRPRDLYLHYASSKSSVKTTPVLTRARPPACSSAVCRVALHAARAAPDLCICSRHLLPVFLGGAASADEQSCAVGAAFADWLVICVLLRQRSSFCPTVLVYVARVVGVGGSHGSHG